MHFNPPAFSAASALSLQNNNQSDVMHSLHNIITDAQDMVSNDQSGFFELYTNRLKIAWFIEIIQTWEEIQKDHLTVI